MVIGSENFAETIMETASDLGKLNSNKDKRNYEWFFPIFTESMRFTARKWAKKKRGAQPANWLNIYSHLNIVTMKDNKMGEKQRKTGNGSFSSGKELFKIFKNHLKDEYKHNKSNIQFPDSVKVSDDSLIMTHKYD